MVLDRASKKTENSPPPEQSSFQGKQLSLFQDLLFNNAGERADLSNTIELWDAVPKYYISRRQQGKLRKDGFLPSVEKVFEFKGQKITVRLRPARLTIDGKDKEFFPAAQEELVEDALRKISSNPGNGYLDEDRSGVSFTLHQLRNEMKAKGHTLSYYQVVESLKILRRTGIEIESSDKKSFYETSPVTSLATVTQEDRRRDPSSRWHVDFSSLVTIGIKTLKYRQYNYGLTSRLKGQLTRYLHKRLSHNYVQASLLFPYNISMKGVARDSGLIEYSRPKDNRRKLEQSFDELISANILMSYKVLNVERGVRRALLDVLYELTPGHDFIDEIKKANSRVKQAKKEILEKR